MTAINHDNQRHNLSNNVANLGFLKSMQLVFHVFIAVAIMLNTSAFFFPFFYSLTFHSDPAINYGGYLSAFKCKLNYSHAHLREINIFN